LAPAMATLGGRAVLFGGYAGNEHSVELGDTWTWDGSGWSEQHVQGPSGRSQASMASDGDALILFGGYTSVGHPVGDTWSWSGTTWTAVTAPGPGARAGAAMTALSR